MNNFWTAMFGSCSEAILDLFYFGKGQTDEYSSSSAYGEQNYQKQACVIGYGFKGSDHAIDNSIKPPQMLRDINLITDEKDLSSENYNTLLGKKWRPKYIYILWLQIGRSMF